jgi:hypothetical protein
MALIEDLQEVPMDRNRVHDVTETTYCVFTDDRGQNYLQINTYGRLIARSRASGVRQFSSELPLSGNSGRSWPSTFRRHEENQVLQRTA